MRRNGFFKGLAIYGGQLNIVWAVDSSELLTENSFFETLDNSKRICFVQILKAFVVALNATWLIVSKSTKNAHFLHVAHTFSNLKKLVVLGLMSKSFVLPLLSGISEFAGMCQVDSSS